MTEDAAVPVRHKKRKSKSDSPDEPRVKNKLISTSTSEGERSSSKENNFTVQETQDKSVTNAGKARKKFDKITGTKKILETSHWKLLKQKKKELRLSRRKSSKATTYDDMMKAKKFWEKVRMAVCPPEQREMLITNIYKILQQNLEKLVFTHDGARVIQWLLKMGDPPLRASICNQLEPVLSRMTQSTYASFCVRRIFKYGSSESHAKVIQSFAGHVVKFMCHSVAAPVVEFAYSQWATIVQKATLRQEFYGSMSQVATPGQIHCLADVYKDTPQLKEATLQATKDNILKVLNKSRVQSSLLYAVILDYLKTCPDDQPEMLAQIRPFLLDLLISKDGSRIAMMCIWHGSVKDRKTAIKLLKGKVKDIAMSEHGHWLLLAMFDCVDDTTLLKKVIIPEILSDLISVVSNEHGRQVILYLVGHRDPLYFHPAVVKILQIGDTNKISKKLPVIRRAELLEAMCETMLNAISEEPHVWLANSSIVMVTLAALKYGAGEPLRLAFEAVAKFISNKSNMMTVADNTCHAIEHSGVHFLLKKLINDDKGKESPDCFSSVLASIIQPSTIKWWLDSNRGCFILIGLLENGSEETKKNLREKFSSKLLKKLESLNSVGAKILLKKLVSVTN